MQLTTSPHFSGAWNRKPERARRRQNKATNARRKSQGLPTPLRFEQACRILLEHIKTKDSLPNGFLRDPNVLLDLKSYFMTPGQGRANAEKIVTERSSEPPETLRDILFEKLLKNFHTRSICFALFK
jgi:hypothetical protein